MVSQAFTNRCLKEELDRKNELDIHSLSLIIHISKITISHQNQNGIKLELAHAKYIFFQITIYAYIIYRWYIHFSLVKHPELDS